MDFFDTIATRRSDRALDVLSMHTDVAPENPRELSQGLKMVMRNLRPAEKEEYLKALTAIHPDYELFMESIQPNHSDLEDVAHACGCNASGCNASTHANASGTATSTVQSYMATGDAQTIMSEYKDKLSRIEQEQTTNKVVNDKIFKYLVIGALLVIGIKLLKNKL